jgi:hypothetical protein
MEFKEKKIKQEKSIKFQLGRIKLRKKPIKKERKKGQDA